jgi:hypothetical protein
MRNPLLYDFYGVTYLPTLIRYACITSQTGNHFSIKITAKLTVEAGTQKGRFA